MQSTQISIDRADQARKQTPFLTTSEAGEYVGLSRRTLEKMRTTGNGPAYRKHGRYVRYHISDLDAWSTTRQKNSTSEPDVEAAAPHREAPVPSDIRRIAGATGSGRFRA